MNAEPHEFSELVLGVRTVTTGVLDVWTSSFQVEAGDSVSRLE